MATAFNMFEKNSVTGFDVYIFKEAVVMFGI
jgi:hypothetical protein